MSLRCRECYCTSVRGRQNPRMSLGSSVRRLVLATGLAVGGLLAAIVGGGSVGASSIPSCQFLSPAAGLRLDTIRTTRFVEHRVMKSPPGRPAYMCTATVGRGTLGLAITPHRENGHGAHALPVPDGGYKAWLTSTTDGTTSFQELEVNDPENRLGIVVYESNPSKTTRRIPVREALKVANAVLRAGPNAPGVQASARLTARSK
jgi:hypothetical protein